MWLGATSHETSWSLLQASTSGDDDLRSSSSAMLREATHMAASGAAPRSKSASFYFSENPGKLGEAPPSDWRWLRDKHGCRAFACVPVVVAGEPVGCLSLATKGAVLRLGYMPNALQRPEIPIAGRYTTPGLVLVPRGSSLLVCCCSFVAGRLPRLDAS